MELAREVFEFGSRFTAELQVSITNPLGLADVAVTITTWWFSFRYLPRIHFAHLVMVLLLCLSTVYCRYHYVVDVLAGIATAAVLVPLGNWLYFHFRRPVRAVRSARVDVSKPKLAAD